jgi:hypothetical protein
MGGDPPGRCKCPDLGGSLRFGLESYLTLEPNVPHRAQLEQQIGRLGVLEGEK